jgi:hypothetical protein
MSPGRIKVEDLPSKLRDRLLEEAKVEPVAKRDFALLHIALARRALAAARVGTRVVPLPSPPPPAESRKLAS